MKTDNEAYRLLAVIDLGSTSLRMAIGEMDESGSFRVIESLKQSLSIGKDTFTTGSISFKTTEECVRVIRSFKQLMKEYHIVHPDQIRAIATSAVREADNKDAFLDRIFTATDINVEALDETELSRLTYLSIYPHIKNCPDLRKGLFLTIEVGGGTTEVLGMRNREVAFAHTYRLGTLRLREMLEDVNLNPRKTRDLLISNIKNNIDKLKQEIQKSEAVRVLLIGGDARFAAEQFQPDWDQQSITGITSARIKKITGRVLALPAEEIVKLYRLPFPDAETLSPALLTFCTLADELNIKKFLVCGATMREGLLADMTVKGVGAIDFTKQIFHSALELGKKYNFDRPHAEHVAFLSRKLFQFMTEEHQLSQRYELLLVVAAYLHDLGSFISNRSHHKHSMYIIMNSDLFGLSARDIRIISLVARYHRKAPPRPAHGEYMQLNRHHRIAINKMAAILRLADALDRSHVQRIKSLGYKKIGGRVILTAKNVSDVSLEQLAIEQKNTLFESVYGQSVILQGKNVEST